VSARSPAPYGLSIGLNESNPETPERSRIEVGFRLSEGLRIIAPLFMGIAIGQRLGSYEITALLGKGGMGVVYHAHDTKLSRPVAIKFVSAELAGTEARRRFQREAQMASSLNHPHILTIQDVGEFEGRDYIVSEFVDGPSLDDWIQERQRSWQEIVELLVGVADGLAAAHRAGILHRDIKPANILVARNAPHHLGLRIPLDVLRIRASASARPPTGCTLRMRSPAAGRHSCGHHIG